MRQLLYSLLVICGIPSMSSTTADILQNMSTLNLMNTDTTATELFPTDGATSTSTTTPLQTVNIGEDKRLIDDPEEPVETKLPDDIDHIPSVSGFRKHLLPVSEGDEMDITVLKNDNPEISRAHKAWEKYRLLSDKVVSEVGRVQDSLQTIEAEVKDDNRGTQLMSQLKMAKLIMVLLNQILDDEKVEVDENGKKEELSSGEVQIGAGEKEEDEEEEDNEEASDDNQEVTSDSVVPLVAVLAGQSAGGTTPTHHYDGYDSPQWWNMVGWMILLAIVTGGILIGCACAVSQCIPVDIPKLKRSMHPRYSEILWESQSSSRNTMKSLNSFSSLSRRGKDEICYPPGANTADKHRRVHCGQSGNSFDAHKVSYGRGHQCYTTHLYGVNAQLDELKYGDMSACLPETCAQPAPYNKTWCTHRHNRHMLSSGHPSAHVDGCCEYFDENSQLSIPQCLKYLPHQQDDTRPHRVEDCSASEIGGNLTKLPHET